MSRIFITGATGFVGANLVQRLLNKKQEVHIALRPESNLWRLTPILKKIKSCELNLFDYSAVQKALKKIKPEIIYHLAAYGTYPFERDDQSIVKTNIVASFNIFRAAQEIPGLKIIVNVGSSSEYGFNDKPMKESDFPEPNTLYGATKLSQTFLARYFSKCGRVPIITLRLFAVYGPYEKPGRLMPDILINWVKKTPLKLSSPVPRRDFIYIEDALDVFEIVSKRSDLGGEVLNLGTGKDFSVGEVVKIASALFNARPEIIWGAKERRNFDRRGSWRADPAKIKKILKWQPRYSLPQGLKKSFSWFKQNLHLYES